MKKLLGKTLLYLSILLLIPYSYLVWQAKQGVDAFLISHQLGGEVTYQWVVLDHNGQIVLLDVEMGEPRDEPILTAKRVNIVLPSVFDLLGAQESVIHNEFPANISVNLVDGSSNQPVRLADTLGIKFDFNYLDYLYPQQCIASLQKNLSPLRFAASADFAIHRTADVSEISFQAKSLDFANIKGSLKLNNYSESSSDGSFVSDFNIAFFDIALLQKNTQKCLADLQLDKDNFIQTTKAQLIDKAADHNLIFDPKVPDTVAQFMFVPQRIDLALDIEEGKKFSQIPLEPFYQFPEKLGLSFALNSEPLNVIFDQVASEAALTKKGESEQVETVTSEGEVVESKPIENPVLQRYQLRDYIGAKIALDLRNGKRVEGYIQSVNSKSVILLQRKFKGRTVAPFAFNDVRRITLINAEI